MGNAVAVILAGGEGKRFWPITKGKPLLPFLDKPLIQNTLECVTKAGLRESIVVTNLENNDRILAIKVPKARIKTVLQKKPRGMADALLQAEEAVRGKNMLVVNAADVVRQGLFSKVLEAASLPNVDMVVPGLVREEYFPGGYLQVRGDRVMKIVEKPKEGNQPGNLVNLVIHYFSNTDSLYKALRKKRSKRDDIYETAISDLLQTKNAHLVRYRGPFGYVKYPWDILSMMHLFLREKIRKSDKGSAQVHRTASIQGPVVLGSGVRILERATIKGPAYIGPRTVIGTNAMVIESMIGKNCVIGFSSEVARSYIGEGSWLHTNYVGDSVLEGENYFGAGAVTANFRFDERQIKSFVEGKPIPTKKNKLGSIVGRGARVGVNASIMPGVKLGALAQIGPGVVQYDDAPDRSRIFVDSRNTVKTSGKTPEQ